ncbi:PREDICTED: myc target protein 1 isoform X1 [Mandrillus leucophaeus]|uniref:MYC target 1 n=1 Tax=Mandrillus leucophaeus TaxID=9568 RepID=A0A2K5XQL7_MANLE|nr:PREDICTED: myc target protein 1 isoform X1 [Mandrillus leucophaeus]
MPTQVYEGLCKNYFSLAVLQRHRIELLFLDILIFLSLFLFFLLFLVDIMANNTTSLGSPWPGNFWEDLIMSFTVSMAIGLVLGGFIWAVFICLSRRRRASAPISQWSSSRRSRSSYSHGLNRTGFYRHSGCERRSNLSLASLTFQRQASLEQANSFPRKSSFRASTFHPFLQCPPLPVETESQLVTLPSSSISPTISTSHSLSRPDYWSSNSLRVGLSTPPPPAYESIIKAFPDS